MIIAKKIYALSRAALVRFLIVEKLSADVVESSNDLQQYMYSTGDESLSIPLGLSGVSSRWITTHHIIKSAALAKLRHKRPASHRCTK